MNKKIKLLIMKAGGIICSTVETDTIDKFDYHHHFDAERTIDKIDYHHFDAEKFAELIIRECLQKCEQVRDDADTQKKSEFLTESGKMLYEGVYGGASNCGFAIQQHFGVEE